MSPVKGQTAENPLDQSGGTAFFDNQFELDCDNDFLIVSVKMYKFFMAHGKDGLEAKQLYDHLLFASRVQGSKAVKANVNYIKNGLGWGVAKVKKAKAFLSAAGLIQYSQNQGKDGQFGDHKIILKSTWDAESLMAWIQKKAERSGQNDTGGTEIDPPENQVLPVDNSGGSEIEPTADIASPELETLNSRWVNSPPIGSTAPPVTEHNYKGSYKKEISPQEGKQEVVDNSAENEESLPPAASSPPTAGFSLAELKEEMIRLVKTRTKDSMFYFTPLENKILLECFNKYGPEWVLKRFESYMKSKTPSQIDRFHSTDFPKVLKRASEKSFRQAAPAKPDEAVFHQCPVCEKTWSASSTLSSCPGCGMEVKDFNDPDEVNAHRQWFEEFQEARQKRAMG
ncbi:MAG: hypothetical protein PQJ58_15125 [Spirochaetales bacterium]|nr:hypothetical protein [Spirochaetales bacterium]